MLPAGLTADLASAPDQQTLKAVHPPAQTVARILAGRCSCDLIRPRLDDPREDERHLRERYRGLKISRAATISALERHRHAAPVRRHGSWSQQVGEFVAEHSRNAGATLYYLHFSPEAGPLRLLGEPRSLTLPALQVAPSDWLLERRPTLVTR